MTRSFDHRRTPVPDPAVRSLRGNRRTGPIRGVVPGDHEEVAREIARLWEWHLRLERAYKKWLELYGNQSGFGCFYSKTTDNDDSENVVLIYDCQDESGGLTDASGNGNDAAEVDSPTYGEAGPFPAEPTLLAVGLAATSQQTSVDTYDHFTMPAGSIDFAGTDAFTLEIVALLDDATPTTKAGLLSCRDSSGNGWSLEITSGGYLQLRRQTDTITADNGAATDGNYAYFAATYDGTNVRLFVNGVQVTLEASSASITASTVAYLGRIKDSSTNYYLKGDIGFVAIHDRALGPNEILSKAVCLLTTGSGGINDLSTNGTEQAPTTVYEVTGTGGSGGWGTSGRTSGLVAIPNYMYWYNRGYRLMGRGVFNDCGTATEFVEHVGVWYRRADGFDLSGNKFDNFSPRLSNYYDYVSPWVACDAGDQSAHQGENDPIYFSSYAGTSSVFFDWVVGQNTVQVRWYLASDGLPLSQSPPVGPGSAADQILDWDTNTGQWTPGFLTNANVDASAAIAYSKLNLSGGIVNADVNASAAIAYSKLNLSDSIVNDDISVAFADAVERYKTKATIITKSDSDSPYSVGTGDDLILASAASAALAINLPAASGLTGRIVTVKATSVAGGNVTVNANGSETIDGAGTVTISTQYETCTVVCDGSNWHRID